MWAVQEYSERYGIDDPAQALGGRPAAGPQRADYDVTARVVEKAIGHEPALERGLELRPKTGLRLSR